MLTLKTTPPDRVHFPNTNQSHHCWQRYNELVVCRQKNGDDACAQEGTYAQAICPSEWLEQWDEQRASGIFLGVQHAEAKKQKHH